MDAEGLGRKLLLTPPDDPRRTEKQTVGTVTTSRQILTLQALSSPLNAGAAKRGRFSRGKVFESPPAVCPPERPRPFARYRGKNWGNPNGGLANGGLAQKAPIRPKKALSWEFLLPPRGCEVQRNRSRSAPKRAREALKRLQSGPKRPPGRIFARYSLKIWGLSPRCEPPFLIS